MTDTPGLLDRVAQLLLAARGGKELGEGAVLTFLALLVHADTGDGIARPSIDALAEMTGVHRRNVQRALDRLLACGAVESTEVDRQRRSLGGRGRITQFQVAPHAIRGDAATLCRRERVADAPPFVTRNGGGAATVSGAKGGEPATVTAAKGGDTRPKGWRLEAETVAPAPPEHSEHCEHVPPNPPRGAGDPAEDQDEIAEQRLRVLALNRIERVGRVENEFAVRRAIAAFLRDGGTLPELGQLVAASDDGRRSRRDRIGLLTTWLANLGMWRGVLADAGERERTASAPRRAAASVTSPAAARDLIDLPARDGTQ